MKKVRSSFFISVICHFFTFGARQAKQHRDHMFRERSKSSIRKITEMGGSDPTFSASSRPKSSWGRSRPFNPRRRPSDQAQK